MESGDALVVLLENISLKRAEITGLDCKISDISSLETNLKLQLDETVLCLSHLKKNISSKFGDGKQAVINKYQEIQDITSSFEEICAIKVNLQKQLLSYKKELSCLREDEKVLRLVFFSSENKIDKDQESIMQNDIDYANTSSLTNDTPITLSMNDSLKNASQDDEDDEDRETLSMELVRTKLENEGLKREIAELQELRCKDMHALKEFKDKADSLQIMLEESGKLKYREEDVEMLRSSCRLLMDQAEDTMHKAKDDIKKTKDDANKDILRHFQAMEAANDELAKMTIMVGILQQKCDQTPHLEAEIASLRGAVTSLRSGLCEATASNTTLTETLQQSQQNEAAQTIAHRNYIELSEQTHNSLQQTTRELRSQLHLQKAEVQKRETMFLTYQDAMARQLEGLKREAQEAKYALAVSEERLRVQAEREKQLMSELSSFCKSSEIAVKPSKTVDITKHRAVDEDEGDLTSNSDSDSVDSDAGKPATTNTSSGTSHWGVAGGVAKTSAEVKLASLQRQHDEIQRREAHVQRFVCSMQRLLVQSESRTAVSAPSTPSTPTAASSGII